MEHKVLIQRCNVVVMAKVIVPSGLFVVRHEGKRYHSFKVRSQVSQTKCFTAGKKEKNVS